MSSKAGRSAYSKSEDSRRVYCDPCRFSGKSALAMKYCSDCNGNLCTNCVNAHMTVSSTRNHATTYIEIKRPPLSRSPSLRSVYKSSSAGSGSALVTHPSNHRPRSIAEPPSSSSYRSDNFYRSTSSLSDSPNYDTKLYRSNSVSDSASYQSNYGHGVGETSSYQSMYTTSNSASVSNVKPTSQHKTSDTKCIEHGKHVMFFCLVHDELCCSDCYGTSHLECKLQAISKAATGSRDGRELRKVENEVKRLQERFDDARKERQTNLQQMTNMGETFTNAVTSYRRNINTILDKLEQGLLKRKDRHLEMKIEELTSCLTSCQEADAVLNGTLNMLDIAAKQRDEQQLFMTMKKVQAISRRYENLYASDVERLPKHYAFHFQPEVSIEKFLKSLNDLGDLKDDNDTSNGNGATLTSNKTAKPGSPDGAPWANNTGHVPSKTGFSSGPAWGNNTPNKSGFSSGPAWGTTTPSKSGFSNSTTAWGNTKTSTPESPVSPPVQDFGPAHMWPSSLPDSGMQSLQSLEMTSLQHPRSSGELNVKIPSDKKTCSITGSAFTSDDKLLVADATNRKIKLFAADLRVIAHVETRSAPRDVTIVSNSDIACTLPNDRSVQLIQICGRQLLVKRTLLLDIECCGITAYDRELYITSGWSTEKEVQVVDLQGNVRRRLVLQPGIMKCPLYITVDVRLGHIFVSDYESGIVQMDTNGRLLSRYNDDVTKGFMGICSSVSGDVFVCTLHPSGISKVRAGRRSLGSMMSLGSSNLELEPLINLPNKGGQRPRSVAFSWGSDKMAISFVGQSVDILSIYQV